MSRSTRRVAAGPTGRRVRLRVTVELGLLTLASALALLPLAAFYGSPWWLPPVLGGLLLGTGLGVVAGWRRWPGWLLAPLALLVVAAYQVWAVHWATTSVGVPSFASARALLDGLVSGWARMLTVALPADPVGDVLAFPVALAFLAGLVGAVMVVRTGWRAALALPPLLLLLVALSYTASRPGDALAATAAALGVLLLLLLVRAAGGAGRPVVSAGVSGSSGAAGAPDGAASPAATSSPRAAGSPGTAGSVEGEQWGPAASPTRSSRRALGRVALGVPGVVLVVALAAAGAILLPLADGSARVDPRAAYPEEVELRQALSPLVEVQPQALGESTELYRIRLTRLDGEYPEQTRVRIAALDTFDGALWTASGDFLRAGNRLSVARPPADPVGTVQLEVEVVGPVGDFLPVLGQPTSLSGLDAAVEKTSGSLVALDPPTAGERYVIEAELPAGDGVKSAGVPTDATGYTELVDEPDWLAEEARRIVDQEGAGTVWGQLVALKDFFRERPYAPQAPPGHSYAAIERTLLGTEEDRAGHVEQYAAGYALLARSLGYPTRIAVGYLLNEDSLDGDTYVVSSTDAHAWPEVQLDGYGWVAFEPSNPDNRTVVSPPRAPDAAPGQDAVTDVVPPAQEDPRAETGAQQGPGLTAGRVVAWGLYVLAALAGLVVLGLVATVLGKLLRRAYRRSRGSPARRIAAAWAEARDRLRELGYDAPDSATPGEVAVRAGTGPAAAAQPDLTELAVIATSAVYAPEPPQEPAAVRAWQLEAAARSAVGRGTPLARRVLATLDPRPLLGLTPAARPRGFGVETPEGTAAASTAAQPAATQLSRSADGTGTAAGTGTAGRAAPPAGRTSTTAHERTRVQ